MKKALVYLILCCTALPAGAQTLTLDECRAAAAEHNRTLRDGRFELEAALQTRREALTGYFPQVSATGGVFQAQHGLVQADFGMTIPQLGTMNLPLSMVKRGIVGGITAVQPVFAGLKIVNGNKLARLGEEVGRLQLQKTESEVREQTDAYYWQVVSLRDNLSTIEAVERQLEEIHRQVELSVKAGLVTTNDLLRVELRQQEIASNRLKVENGLKVSKMLLAQHIGVDWRAFDVAAAEFGQPEAPAAFYVPVEEALDNRAEYRLAEKNVEAQKYRKRMERGKRLPTVGVGAGYLYYNVTDKDVDDGLVFAQVSVPISDWWGGAHALKKARIREQQAENDRLLDAIVADWDAKGRDGKEMQRYFFQSRCDTMGANEHKGIHQWQTCAPKELRQAITTGEPYRPRVMYEMSGNKYAVMGPSLEWKKAYDEQDFVIQQYPNMTSFTVQTVDLFLPTTEWLEYDSYEAPGTHFNRHYARCQVTHLGETVNPFVSPYQVAEAAVEKLGAENVFDPDAYKVPFFESLEAARAAWAEQMGKGSWQEMLDDIDHRFTEEPMDDYMAYYQYKEPVSDGLPRGFATMSRKVDVYSEAMLRLARTGFPYMYPFDQPACDDYDPICTFKEPTESPVEGQPGYDPEYPLVITTGRLPHFHHGTMRHAPFIREVMPAPELKINPETAAEYGIEHLDWVKITSRRGSSNARAYLTQGIAPGVLITERFWNPECFDETQESITPGIEECGYNIMSADELQNPCFATNSYRAFTVKIEKTERPERIWIESKQFQPFMPTLSGEPVTEEVF